MPRVELSGALADGVRGHNGVDEVVALAEVEVLAHRLETLVAFGVQ